MANFLKQRYEERRDFAQIGMLKYAFAVGEAHFPAIMSAIF